MKRTASIVLVSLILLASACSGPSDDRVKGDFLKEHPTYTILSVHVGEGDGAAAYFHIKYKKHGEELVCEDVWQYMDVGAQEWKLTHKETIKERSPQ
jgi:hypothetical protein